MSDLKPADKNHVYQTGDGFYILNDATKAGKLYIVTNMDKSDWTVTGKHLGDSSGWTNVKDTSFVSLRPEFVSVQRGRDTNPVDLQSQVDRYKAITAELESMSDIKPFV